MLNYLINCILVYLVHKGTARIVDLNACELYDRDKVGHETIHPASNVGSCLSFDWAVSGDVPHLVAVVAAQAA
jgi:hypothetical protein